MWPSAFALALLAIASGVRADDASRSLRRGEGKHTGDTSASSAFRCCQHFRCNAHHTCQMLSPAHFAWCIRYRSARCPVRGPGRHAWLLLGVRPGFQAVSVLCASRDRRVPRSVQAAGLPGASSERRCKRTTATAINCTCDSGGDAKRFPDHRLHSTHSGWRRGGGASESAQRACQAARVCQSAGQGRRDRASGGRRAELAAAGLRIALPRLQGRTPRQATRVTGEGTVE